MNHPAQNGTEVEREWMDLSALTRYASVSGRTLREWIHRGANPLPAVRVGTKILVSRRRFDAWLEQHQLKPFENIDVQGIVEEMVSGVRPTN